DRLGLALAGDREADGIDAPAGEVLRDRVGAALRELLVVVVRADVVGVADDGQRSLAVAHHHVGDLAHGGLEAGLDVRRIGLERSLIGHRHAHYVVRHGVDARLPGLDLLGEVLLQVLALVVHVGADGSAGEPAADRADQRALGPVAAVRHGADRGADAGADQRAGLPVLPAGHAGAAFGGAAAGESESNKDGDGLFHRGLRESYSERRIRAASTMERILPSATSRGRYFMPQSGARIMSSGRTNAMAFFTRAATVCGVSTFASERSMQPTMILLFFRVLNTEQSRFDWAVSIEICLTGEPDSSGRNEYPEGRAWMIAAYPKQICTAVSPSMPSSARFSAFNPYSRALSGRACM